MEYRELTEFLDTYEEEFDYVKSDIFLNWLITNKIMNYLKEFHTEGFLT